MNVYIVIAMWTRKHWLYDAIYFPRLYYHINLANIDIHKFSPAFPGWFGSCSRGVRCGCPGLPFLKLLHIHI